MNRRVGGEAEQGVTQAHSVRRGRGPQGVQEELPLPCWVGDSIRMAKSAPSSSAWGTRVIGKPSGSRSLTGWSIPARATTSSRYPDAPEGMGSVEWLIFRQLPPRRLNDVINRKGENISLAGTVEASAAGPTPCLGMVANARGADRIREVVAAATRSGPPLHSLVNVVGGLPRSHWGRLLDYEPSPFDEVIQRNLNSTLYSSQAVAAALVNAHTPGSIVHVA
jgi:hypothetical protein